MTSAGERRWTEKVVEQTKRAWIRASVLMVAGYGMGHGHRLVLSEVVADVLTIVSCSFSSNRSTEREDGEAEERDIVTTAERPRRLDKEHASGLEWRWKFWCRVAVEGEVHKCFVARRHVTWMELCRGASSEFRNCSEHNGTMLATAAAAPHVLGSFCPRHGILQINHGPS